MCKMTPISVKLNLKNFILIPCAVLELLRKVTLGGGRNPPLPGEIGLTYYRGRGACIPGLYIYPNINYKSRNVR